ncbi:MAG: hypothetical protein U1E60_32150 [Reyranellaceae bacterium]
MEAIEFRLTGVSPGLMVNNPQTVNPFNEYTQRMKEITDRRKRSDDDLRDLLKLKWRAALYYDDKIGPYLPAICVWRSIHDAAKISRGGKTIERGLHIAQDRLAIEYDGPRDAEALYASPKFVDVRDASPGGKRVTACRPVFIEWQMTAPFFYEPSLLNERDLVAAVQTAGKLVGVGTYRQRFGRFEARVLN